MNANSLSNLNPANRTGKPGVRKHLTTRVVERIHETLEHGYAQFLQDLEELPVRDRVAAYLKLMQLVIPRESLMKISSGEDGEGKPTVNFVFTQPANPPSDAPTGAENSLPM